MSTIFQIVLIVGAWIVIGVIAGITFGRALYQRRSNHEDLKRRREEKLAALRRITPNGLDGPSVEQVADAIRKAGR